VSKNLRASFSIQNGLEQDASTS